MRAPPTRAARVGWRSVTEAHPRHRSGSRPGAVRRRRRDRPARGRLGSHRCEAAGQSLQRPLDLTPAPCDEQRLIRTARGERRDHGCVLLVRVAPDVAKQLEELAVKMLAAARGEVDGRAATSSQVPPDRAEQSAPAREVQVHDRVGPLEREIHGEGAVHHPCLGFDQVRNQPGPLVLRPGLPVGQEEVRVQVDDRQGQTLADPTCESRLAGAR